MNTFIVTAIRCSLMFLIPALAYAGSAEWNLNPTSGDWNTAANWTPMTVPNGPADVATFGASNSTAISLSANTIVNGITFTPAASNYTITGSSQLLVDLTLSGVGITNNSGTTQNFVTEGSGRIYLTDHATAGSSTTFTNFNFMIFLNNSTAGSATFINNSGSTFLEHSSTAGNATFINNGGFQGEYPGTFITSDAPDALSDATFINNGGPFAGALGGYTVVWLTAFGAQVVGHPVFTNEGGAADGAFGGQILVTSTTEFPAVPDDAVFTNNGGLVSGAFGGSTIVRAGSNATFINNGATVSGAEGGSTIVEFTGTNGTFINNGATVTGAGAGSTVFKDSAFAGAATLIANGGTVAGAEGGAIFFQDDSTGGTSRVEVFGNGSLDISGQDSPGVTIGSIEGDGEAFLGANNLTVGSNNLSTTFSGKIFGDTGGSFTKIGTGILTFQDRAKNDYIADTVGLNLVSGSIINLNFSRAPDTIGPLTVNGVPQTQGLYGGPASGAPNQLPEFAGTGKVRVTPRPHPTPPPR
jgi:hypothetical protein